MLKNKIIVVDFSYFVHQSIFSRNSALQRKDELSKISPSQASQMFVPPATYTSMSSIIGTLKKVGINEELGDVIILALDSPNSWRKDFQKTYKANRKEQREQAQYVDWSKEYESQNKLLDKIDNGLPIWLVRGERLEADDVIATITRYFKDNEVVIISPDKDFIQLMIYDNVRIFNCHPKAKNNPYRILDLDREKEKEKAYKELMTKIRKETSDNLVSEVLTEQDYDDRKKCVSLLELPDFVLDRLELQLDTISKTEKICFHPEAFSKGIQKKLVGFFDQDKVISYDYCRKKLERKLKRKAKKV